MEMIAFDALLFPSDGRPPHLVALMTSPASGPDPHCASACRTRMPHPEIHMDYIADIGYRAWRYHVSLQNRYVVKSTECSTWFQIVEALDGMNKKFSNPYIIFYPTVSRDGMPFPVNTCIREIQGKRFTEAAAWKGNIVIAKYCESPFSS